VTKKEKQSFILDERVYVKDAEENMTSNGAKTLSARNSKLNTIGNGIKGMGAGEKRIIRTSLFYGRSHIKTKQKYPR
jgi:hypothetical protein